MDRYQKRFGDTRNFGHSVHGQLGGGASSLSPAALASDRKDTNIIIDREMHRLHPQSSSAAVGGIYQEPQEERIGLTPISSSTRSNAPHSPASSAMSFSSHYAYLGLGRDARQSKEWLRSWDAWIIKRAVAAERRPIMAKAIRPFLDAVGHFLSILATVVAAVARLYAGALSSRQHCLVAFFLLSAVTIFFIGWCMDSTELAAFTVPAYHHGWNRRKKAKACRKAGLYNLLCVVAVVAFPKIVDCAKTLCRQGKREVKARLLERSGAVRDKSRQYESNRGGADDEAHDDDDVATRGGGGTSLGGRSNTYTTTTVRTSNLWRGGAASSSNNAFVVKIDETRNLSEGTASTFSRRSGSAGSAGPPMTFQTQTGPFLMTARGVTSSASAPTAFSITRQNDRERCAADGRHAEEPARALALSGGEVNSAPRASLAKKNEDSVPLPPEDFVFKKGGGGRVPIPDVHVERGNTGDAEGRVLQNAAAADVVSKRVVGLPAMPTMPCYPLPPEGFRLGAKGQ